jgi:hypothetical protein
MEADAPKLMKRSEMSEGLERVAPWCDAARRRALSRRRARGGSPKKIPAKNQKINFIF